MQMKFYGRIALWVCVGAILAVGAGSAVETGADTRTLIKWGVLGACTGVVFGAIAISRSRSSRSRRFWIILWSLLFAHSIVLYGLVVTFERWPTMLTAVVTIGEWAVLESIFIWQGMPMDVDY